MRNLECVNGVLVYRQQGKTIFSRVCPKCLGKGCMKIMEPQKGACPERIKRIGSRITAKPFDIREILKENDDNPQ